MACCSLAGRRPEDWLAGPHCDQSLAQDCCPRSRPAINPHSSRVRGSTMRVRSDELCAVPRRGIRESGMCVAPVSFARGLPERTLLRSHGCEPLESQGAACCGDATSSAECLMGRRTKLEGWLTVCDQLFVTNAGTGDETFAGSASKANMPLAGRKARPRTAFATPLAILALPGARFAISGSTTTLTTKESTVKKRSAC